MVPFVENPPGSIEGAGTGDNVEMVKVAVNDPELSS
jgi:hypothetical protein